MAFGVDRPSAYLALSTRSAGLRLPSDTLPDRSPRTGANFSISNGPVKAACAAPWQRSTTHRILTRSYPTGASSSNPAADSTSALSIRVLQCVEAFVLLLRDGEHPALN